MPSLGGSGGSTTQTTKQGTTAVDPWVQAAQGNLLGDAQRITAPFIQTPNSRVVGFSDDTLQGQDLVRQVAQDSFTPGSFGSLSSGGGLAPTWTQSTQAFMAPVSTTSAQDMTAAQTTAADINALMPSWQQGVIDPAIRTLTRARDQRGATADAAAAAAGSFGGSRGAIQRAALDRDFGDQVASTTGNLYAQGYGQAQQAALSNTGYRQQAASSNQAAQNAAANLNANLGTQVALANAGAQNAATATNVAAQNARDQFNATQGVTQATALEALRTQEQARRLAAAQGVLGLGSTIEGRYQNVLDVPYTSLGSLAGVIPQQYNTSTSEVGTQPNNSPSTLQQLLGAGLSIAGLRTAGGGSLGGLALGGLFSDERAKTDITELGKDPESGLTMYAYRYKDDPKTYPKVVGPMAQEVERKFPGSTREVGGRKVITGGFGSLAA